MSELYYYYRKTQTLGEQLPRLPSERELRIRLAAECNLLPLLLLLLLLCI